MEERIQKILARVGYGSRRSCEKIISSGRVTVNGKGAQLGAKADPHVDDIRVDGFANVNHIPRIIFHHIAARLGGQVIKYALNMFRDFHYSIILT